MAQHFLLSAAARTLKLKDIYRMSDDEAFKAFAAIRFAENGGEAFCPACGCTDPYFIATRRKWKCRACAKQFSATSGTIFASRKMAFVDLLAAICIFANCAKGISALQLSRDLDCQYKTAFVLAHKLREAMARGNDDVTLDGEVEIDGAHFGGRDDAGEEVVHRLEQGPAVEDELGRVVEHVRGGLGGVRLVLGGARA